jgi:hypothetical protein
MARPDTQDRAGDVATRRCGMPNLKQTCEQGKPKKEAREPVLLQWKDREKLG